MQIHVVCLEYYWRVSSSSYLIALVGSKWAPGQRVGPVQRAPDVKVRLLPLVRVLHRLVHAALGPRAHRPARGERKRHHQDHSHDPAEDRQPAAAVRPWFAVALGRGERARGHRVVRAPVPTRFDGKGKASFACGARAFNRWTSKTRGLEFSLAVWKSRLTWFSSHALFGEPHRRLTSLRRVAPPQNERHCRPLAPTHAMSQRENMIAAGASQPRIARAAPAPSRPRPFSPPAPHATRFRELRRPE